MKTAAAALALTLMLDPAAMAAPPPPPPEYVDVAAKQLTGDMSPDDIPKSASLFAEDVKAFENGRLFADGRPAWVSVAGPRIARPQRRIIGYSEGHDTLLVVDEVDTVDRANLPPPPAFLADPRPNTRAILYEFGQDGLIHAVRISVATGFWEPSR